METAQLPVDPDSAPVGGAGMLGAVAAGGALGSVARWSVSEGVSAAGGVPWATLIVNVVGSLLLGALLVTLAEAVTDRPLLRPFLGVGVLGGFTTFSTYAFETRHLLAGGQYAVAGAYALGSVATGLLAVWAGMLATQRLVDVRGDR